MKSPLPSQRRRLHVRWIAFAALQSIIAALLVWTLARDRADVETLEGDRLQVQARVIDDNLIRQLEGANRALEGVIAGLNGARRGIDTVAATGNLKLLADAMPGVSTMLILDAGGTIVASSRDGLVGKNFKDRAYFDVPRRGADPAVLYVSPPFKTSLDTFVVVVGRVLTDSRGAFAGVVTATLDPDYFNVVLRSVLYAPDMRTTLIHGDGDVFLNLPMNPRALGMNAAHPDSLFSRHMNSGSPSTLTVGRVLATGEDRMVSMRSIQRADLHMDKPMVVAVSRERSAMFGPWRARAMQYGALFAMFALGSALALQVIERRRRARSEVAAAVARERQAGAERVELALRGADLGLWDLHVPSNHLVVNPRERALLGFAPDEALPHGKAWRKLIHPDDRAAVDASILPHLRGEAATYECEHRMQHKDGRWIWVSNRAMIVERDAAGAPLRIVGTHLDVTERKRADAELTQAIEMLRDREEQLRQVTDNMPALVSRLDPQQRFCFANRAYRDWLGIEPSSLLGRSLLEVYGEPVFNQFRHHIEAALAGNRVAYQRELSTLAGVRQVEVALVPQHAADGTVQAIDALMSDITARQQAEIQRGRSEERLSLALEGSGLALFDWDIASGRIFHSAQASALRGEPAVETMGSAMDLQAFVHPEDLAGVLERLTDAVKGLTPVYNAEFRVQQRSGDWLWIRARGRVVERDNRGRAVRVAGTYADINERKLAEGKLRHLAEFDPLTNLPNRALFQDRLQQAMARAARGKPMALMFLDIDHFKTINDTLGHEAGDRLLKAFAARMQASVRRSDTVARLSGDEFTIILEGVNGLPDASMLADKLIRALREPVALIGQQVEVTASIGIALCSPGEADDGGLLRRADAALYEAKRRGRNGYFCDESVTQVGPLDAARELIREAGLVPSQAATPAV